MSYCELHCCSAFSFLRGGSFPEQLAEVAAELEMPAMALLDRNGVYGAQRFSVAAREHGVRPIIGAELSTEGGSILPVLVENRTGYKNLCELLTQAHLRSEKGNCAVRWDELPEFAEVWVALANSRIVNCRASVSDANLARRFAETPYKSAARAQFLIDTFRRESVFVELQRHFLGSRERFNHDLVDLANHYRLPPLATNGVQYAKPCVR